MKVYQRETELRTAGVGDLLYRRIAIAPFGVHLQVAAVLLKGRTRECGIREDPPDFGTAQKVSPKLAPSLDVGAAILIAASSNNLVKGVYAYALSDRNTGIMSLALLTVLAVVGLVPLAWVSRWSIG